MVYDSWRQVMLLGWSYGPPDLWRLSWRSSTPDEVCTGGVDEDSDGLTDCDDHDCDFLAACRH